MGPLSYSKSQTPGRKLYRRECRQIHDYLLNPVKRLFYVTAFHSKNHVIDRDT